MNLVQRIKRLEAALGFVDKPEMECKPLRLNEPGFLPSMGCSTFQVCSKLRGLTNWQFHDFWYGDVLQVLREARRRGYLEISSEDLDRWDTLQPAGMRLFAIRKIDQVHEELKAQLNKGEDEIPY